MTLSTANIQLVQTSPGRLFIVPAEASFTATTFPNKIIEMFALFYADGSKRKVLTASAPWAVISANGIKTKMKQEAVMADTNDGPPFPAGYQHLKAEAEVEVMDLSAEKFLEVLSGTANSLVTIAAATGQSGRETVGLGGEAYPTTYTVLYQYPSKRFIGEFDNLLIPFAVFEVDTDYELSKKSLRQGKLKMSALGREDFVNPDTGRQVNWIEDRATAAAL